MRRAIFCLFVSAMLFPTMGMNCIENGVTDRIKVVENNLLKPLFTQVTQTTIPETFQFDGDAQAVEPGYRITGRAGMFNGAVWDLYIGMDGLAGKVGASSYSKSTANLTPDQLDAVERAIQLLRQQQENQNPDDDVEKMTLVEVRPETVSERENRIRRRGRAYPVVMRPPNKGGTANG